jgi:hypothetical protein
MFILILMSLLNTYLVPGDDSSLFSSFFKKIAVLIYNNTTFLAPLWEFAPRLYFPNIFVEENLNFLFIIGLFLLGIIMRDSGLHLRRRIKEVKQRAEEKVWERSLSGEASHNDVLAFEISLKSKDNWYTRPAGIIVLAIIGGYLVNILSKITGIL